MFERENYNNIQEGTTMEYRDVLDVGDEGNARFEAIPYYALGDTPDTMQGEENLDASLYRCITIKRGLVEAYEEAILPDVIVDALADLRHLCDRCGVNFASCDKSAYDHYAKEKGA